MSQIINRDEKMKQIFETAQKMKKGEIKTGKSYSSIEAFIDDVKTS